MQPRMVRGDKFIPQHEGVVPPHAEAVFQGQGEQTAGLELGVGAADQDRRNPGAADGRGHPPRPAAGTSPAGPPRPPAGAPDKSGRQRPTLPQRGPCSRKKMYSMKNNSRGSEARPRRGFPDLEQRGSAWRAKSHQPSWSGTPSAGTRRKLTKVPFVEACPRGSIEHRYSRRVQRR